MTHEERVLHLMAQAKTIPLELLAGQMCHEALDLAQRLDALEAKPDPRAAAEREVLGTLA